MISNRYKNKWLKLKQICISVVVSNFIYVETHISNTGGCLMQSRDETKVTGKRAAKDPKNMLDSDVTINSMKRVTKLLIRPIILCCDESLAKRNVDATEI